MKVITLVTLLLFTTSIISQNSESSSSGNSNLLFGNASEFNPAMTGFNGARLHTNFFSYGKSKYYSSRSSIESPFKNGRAAFGINFNRRTHFFSASNQLSLKYAKFFQLRNQAVLSIGASGGTSWLNVKESPSVFNTYISTSLGIGYKTEKLRMGLSYQTGFLSGQESPIVKGRGQIHFNTSYLFTLSKNWKLLADANLHYNRGLSIPNLESRVIFKNKFIIGAGIYDDITTPSLILGVNIKDRLKLEFQVSCINGFRSRPVSQISLTYRLFK